LGISVGNPAAAAAAAAVVVQLVRQLVCGGPIALGGLSAAKKSLPATTKTSLMIEFGESSNSSAAAAT
jgi:predicted dinucleotide-binding enzyme